MSVKIVSYFTKGTIYESIISNYLLPCLDYFQLPYVIYDMPDLKRWDFNAVLKSKIIHTAMKTFPNDNIIWMDSDTIIREYPFVFGKIPERCDIGLYYMEYTDHWGGVPPGVEMPKPELSTAVMYFKNSPKMVSFIEEWMEECIKVNPNHKTSLEKLVNKYMIDNLSYFMLPRSYAYLAEREDDLPVAIPMKNPTIVHFGFGRFGKKDLYDGKPFDGGLDVTK